MNRSFVTVVIALAVAFILGTRLWHLHELTAGRTTTVALIYGTTDSASMSAWAEELREAGVPFEWIGQGDFGLLDPGYLSRRYSAIVFPDHLDVVMPAEIVATATRYVHDGGTLLVVDDAGTRRSNGTYLNAGAFSSLLGLNYLRYAALRNRAYGHASIDFTSMQAARDWHVPLGKLDGKNAISSYYYGALSYPVHAAQQISGDVRVDASSAYGPVFTRHAFGAGTAFYVGMPLGYLRANSDGFPLQIAVQRIIVDAAQTPHLVASPQGVGGVVINWHIDSNSEWIGIPHLEQTGLLRPDIRYTFDVTAGPDRDRPGDGEGFDACGAGAAYLRIIENYGTIGSHGGWLHNGFAWAVERHHLSEARMQALIDKNDACLQRMTGYPVRDYAAPDGAHPQPAMTQALDNLGISSYYYTGDTGAAAERALYNNALVSQRVWAFPIQPLGPYASVAEMRRGGVPPARFLAWLNSIADEAARDRTILLFYSHSYDMQYEPYDAPFNAFLDRLSREQRANVVRSTPMKDATAFLTRLLDTHATFAHIADRVDIQLNNERGLRDVAFALPKTWVTANVALPPGIRAGRADTRFEYFWITTNDRNFHWTYSLAKGRVACACGH